MTNTGMGIVKSTTGAETVMTSTIIANTAFGRAMRASIGAVERSPSVTIVKSASDRYMAADISILATSINKITVKR